MRCIWKFESKYNERLYVNIYAYITTETAYALNNFTTIKEIFG